MVAGLGGGGGGAGQEEASVRCRNDTKTGDIENMSSLKLGFF